MIESRVAILHRPSARLVNRYHPAHASTAHPQRFLGLSLAAAGATATAIVYDANAASGTVVARLTALTNTSASFTVPHSGVKVATNLFVAVTGTGSNALVYWN